MGDLRLFVKAVWDHWVMVLTGGVASVAALLHAQYGPDRIPNWIFWSIAGVFLLVAFFLAWRNEHSARLKAEHHTPSLDYEAIEKLAKHEDRRTGRRNRRPESPARSKKPFKVSER
jgi:hypothetical protein